MVTGRNTRMFDKVTCTWNPVICYPCPHRCVYCWVPVIVERFNIELYRKSSGVPILVEKRLRQRFRKGELVFVCDMSDLFADAIPDSYILKVLEVVKKFPNTEFLLLTKNPRRYHTLVVRYGEDIFPRNVWFGVTVETDDDELYVRYRISRAPSPSERIDAMYSIAVVYYEPNVWISIEPIIHFTSPRQFAAKILRVAERAYMTVIYVGYDNYGFLKRLGIPEPPLDKTLELVDILKQHGIEVRTKTLRKA